MGEDALKDIGYRNKDGSWTGKDGINSKEDFLASKYAQEKAFAEYVEKLRGYLRSHGSLGINYPRSFPGVKGEGIRITEHGLIAAAHRQGALSVDIYLRVQAGSKPKWSSTFSVEAIRSIQQQKLAEYRRRGISEDKIPDILFAAPDEMVAKLKRVETRLRQFQNTSA